MKYHLIAFIVVLMMSCNQDSKKQAVSSGSPVKEREVKPVDSSIAPKPLPSAPKIYSTSYEGILPCTDCDGIKTTLKLTSNYMYTASEIYQGKDDAVLQSKGYYNQQRAFGGDPNATLLVLTDSKTASQRYFMQYKGKEDVLILLNNKKAVLGGSNPFKLLKK